MPECPESPRDLKRNLEFRSWLLKRGNASRADRAQIKVWCKNDVLFHANSFIWLFEPRTSELVPFVLYEFQREALRRIVAAIGKHDLVIEKSRDMGATWMFLVAADWLASTRPYQTFLLMSQKEEMVDKAGNPKALFSKIEHIHKHLPEWLRPQVERRKLHMGYAATSSSVDGDSTTKTAGTADRRLAVFFDEFSKVENGYEMLKASRDVTQCRIFNSSYNGRGNAFFEIARGDASENFPRLSLPWTLHPEKSKGLYYDAQGKARSPAYDAQLKRCQDPREMAEEWDMDPSASDYMFFDAARISELKAEHARPPYLVADIVLRDNEAVVDAVRPCQTGPCRFWVYLSAQWRPPRGRQYFVGVDVSGGVDSSDSTISVFDSVSSEKVFEWRARSYQPHEWARRAVAVCRLFNDAKLIWESNGAGGGNFRTAVEGYRYWNVFRMARRHDRHGKRTGTVMESGFVSTKATKEEILKDYRFALYEGRFINRSAESLTETLGYVHYTGGRIEHAPSVAGIDPSKTGRNHGDMVIADALSWHAARECADREHEAAVKSASEDWVDEYLSTMRREQLSAQQGRW